MENLEHRKTEKAEDLKVNFEVICEHDKNYLSVDFELGIVQIIWNGVVGLESAQKLMTLGLDLITAGNCHKLLINRLNLVGFTEEARYWLTVEFWPNKENHLIRHINKFAVAGPELDLKMNFTSLISSRIRKFFSPWLQSYIHDSEEEAVKWLIR